MKTFLLVVLAVAPVLLGGCHKDDMKLKGAPVSDEAAATSVLITIDNLWKTVLKPQLTVTPQSYSDTVLADGPGGKITVEGSYQYHRSSSSSSSTSSSITDVTITFIDYKDKDLYLNGKLRFFDASSTRTACSSSGCATSSDLSMAYTSDEGNGNILPALTIAFKDLTGKPYRDNITLDVSKQYAHWEGSLVNSKHDTISISY